MTTAFSAGGHGGADLPVPIPNTEVKGPIAEGSAGVARARVGRRRLFSFSRYGLDQELTPGLFFSLRKIKSRRRPPDIVASLLV